MSALDHSQVIADQTFDSVVIYTSIMFSLSCLSETLYIEQQLQRRLSSATRKPH